MKKYTNKELQNMLNTYLNNYGDSYRKYQINKIKQDFGKYYKDHLTQMYYFLDMFEDSENPYKKIVDLIEERYGLDINILEVGGGVYPALSDEISKRQKKGKVTVYDPMLSSNLKLKKVNLVKKQFDWDSDVSKYDLIVGKEPCMATDRMIYVSRNKNLLLSPCKCYNLLYGGMSLSKNPLKEWYDYVKTSIEKYGKVDTYYLDKDTNYDNPIYIKTAK